MRLVLLFLLVAATAHAEVAFKAPTIAQSKAMYAAIDNLYRAKSNPDLNAFEDMLADAWVNTHKPDALAKAAKRGASQAAAEDVWELPFANDWLGYMNLQFDSAEIFSASKFSTYAEHPSLFGWLDVHKDELHATPELSAFYDALRQLPEWGAKCEAIVREQTPEGAINV